MEKKIGPYIFLAVLIIVLVFIFGTRYGQKLEKTNKKIDFYLSLPPTAPPDPTEPPLEFETYTHKGCGISFTYPNIFKVEKESSYSAKFAGKKSYIILSCEKQATAEPTLAQNYLTIDEKNPLTGKKILITLEKNMKPLIEKSLKFISP